ncbi:hypothetical protein, partial [Paenibacillus sp. SI8]|uniref:hypothetical protein n=2 Tax=unclassified Paenibacillus TaxID=185978 RepID=UPI0034665EAD
YTYKKHFINYQKLGGTPDCELPWYTTCVATSKEDYFYNTNVTATAGNLKNSTDYQYDIPNNMPYPTEISNKYTNITTGQSSIPVVVKRSYNPHGQILSETDPNNIVTSYQYMEPSTRDSYLSKVIKKLNDNLTQYTNYSRYEKGNVKELTVKDNDNPSGNAALKINYEYDSYGNQIKVTATDNQSTMSVVRTYDVNPPNKGAFLTQQSQQVTDVDRSLSNIVQKMEYDTTTGRLTKFTDGNNNFTQYEYDLLDRVKTATFMDKSNVQLTYDDANNKITTIDQTGVTTVTQWNPLGLKEFVQTIGAGTGKQSFQYDTYSRLW